MRILVFSDTHLTHLFEEKKYRFLKEIISQADRVIINGDFWEGFVVPFDQFIHSPWKDLFPILKSKKTHYIYGNHDKKTFTNPKVSLFSASQGFNHQLRVGERTLIFEHGNRLLPLFDEKFGLSQPFRAFTLGMHTVTRLVLRKYKKGFIDRVYRPYNGKIKNKIPTQFLSNEILVCGHTHAAEIDWKNRFINSGLINHGLGQYLTIDNGKVQLHEEWYE